MVILFGYPCFVSGGCLGNLISSLQGQELVRVLQCVEGIAMELWYVGGWGVGGGGAQM